MALPLLISRMPSTVQAGTLSFLNYLFIFLNVCARCAQGYYCPAGSSTPNAIMCPNNTFSNIFQIDVFVGRACVVCCVVFVCVVWMCV
jgi:hypothetical protein